MGWQRKKTFYGRKRNFSYRLNGRQINLNPNNLGDEGRKFEDRVEQVLYQMFNRGEIAGFDHHPANSPEDREGKDFTVRKMVNAELVSKSFGVTISMKRASQSQIIHPDTPQFHLPLWSKDEEIVSAILGLFPKS